MFLYFVRNTHFKSEAVHPNLGTFFLVVIVVNLRNPKNTKQC